MNGFTYFEPCERLEIAEQMIPLLLQYGLWYEIRQTSAQGWQVRIPYLVNGRSHQFSTPAMTDPQVLGARYLGKNTAQHVSFREAIAMLQELQQIYARLETRVLIGDWRNSDEYRVLSPDITDAELIQLVLTID